MEEFGYELLSAVERPRILVVGKKTYAMECIVHSILSCTAHDKIVQPNGWAEMHAFREKLAHANGVVRNAHYCPNIVHKVEPPLTNNWQNELQQWVGNEQLKRTSSFSLLTDLIGVKVLVALIMEYVESNLGLFCDVRYPPLSIPWSTTDMLRLTLVHCATSAPRQQRRVNDFINAHNSWMYSRPGKFDFVFIDVAVCSSIQMRSIPRSNVPESFIYHHSASWLVYISSQQQFYHLPPPR